MGTTFTLPNFVGDLFSISPEETPLLSTIGGLTGGREAFDKSFEWEYYDLRDADAARQRVEGDDAPNPQERVRQSANNVLEIHMESVSVSYTRLGSGAYQTTQRGASPVPDELRWQMDVQLKQVARDVEASFIVGTYQNPGNNSTARKTRGILAAIVTNVIDMGNAAITDAKVLDLFQFAYQNGGFQEGETRTIVCGASAKRRLSELFTPTNNTPLSRNVGGVNLQVIQTDFGLVNVMLDRNMPNGQLVALSLEDLAPRFLNIPGKGHFFWEPLGKAGAREESMLYGEIGLEYGNELKHAKLVDFTTPYDNVTGSGS